MQFFVEHSDIIAILLLGIILALAFIVSPFEIHFEDGDEIEW